MNSNSQLSTTTINLNPTLLLTPENKNDEQIRSLEEKLERSKKQEKFLDEFRQELLSNFPDETLINYYMGLKLDLSKRDKTTGKYLLEAFMDKIYLSKNETIKTYNLKILENLLKNENQLNQFFEMDLGSVLFELVKNQEYDLAIYLINKKPKLNFWYILNNNIIKDTFYFAINNPKINIELIKKLCVNEDILKSDNQTFKTLVNDICEGKTDYTQKIEVFNYLINNHTDKFDSKSLGNTLLDLCKASKYDLVKLLLQKKPDVNRSWHYTEKEVTKDALYYVVNNTNNCDIDLGLMKSLCIHNNAWQYTLEYTIIVTQLAIDTKKFAFAQFLINYIAKFLNAQQKGAMINSLLKESNWRSISEDYKDPHHWYFTPFFDGFFHHKKQIVNSLLLALHGEKINFDAAKILFYLEIHRTKPDNEFIKIVCQSHENPKVEFYSHFDVFFPNTIITKTIYNKHWDTAQFFLENYAADFRQDDLGNALLMLASHADDDRAKQLTALLIEKRPDAAQFAITESKELSLGSKISNFFSKAKPAQPMDPYKKTPLLQILAKNKHYKTVELLLSKQAKHLSSDDMLSVVTSVMAQGHLFSLECLLGLSAKQDDLDTMRTLAKAIIREHLKSAKNNDEALIALKTKIKELADKKEFEYFAKNKKFEAFVSKIQKNKSSTNAPITTQSTTLIMSTALSTAPAKAQLAWSERKSDGDDSDSTELLLPLTSSSTTRLSQVKVEVEEKDPSKQQSPFFELSFSSLRSRNPHVPVVDKISFP